MAARIFSVLLLLVLCGATTAWGAGETVTVKVKNAQVRSLPSFVGTPGRAITYGTHVEVLEEQGSWRRVGAPSGVKGWLHVSALTARRTELSAGSGAHVPVAREKEISIAGKGFSAGGSQGEATIGLTPGVEKLYRKRSPKGYSGVEAMVKTAFESKALLDFLSAGGATPAEQAR